MASETISDPAKTCTQCGETKPATAEYYHRHAPACDGLKPRCKTCRREETKAYYSANAERLRAQAISWQRDNADRSAQRKRDWAQRNREKVRITKQTYKKSKQSDPKYRISVLMGCALRKALVGEKRGRHWCELVGYSPEELALHIERQFRPGMTWGNFGRRWHIDHIRPIASFNYLSPDDEEFKECWSLTNLRPCWVAENLRKGATRIFLI